MSDIRVNALVIRAINYSENDKLLTLLTMERGKITARIRGCKSPKSKLRFAASPLSFGEYILSCRNNKYLVIGCSAKESFYAIGNNLDKYYVSSIMLEMANKLVLNDQECKGIMVLLLRLLKILAYSDINPLQIAVIAMLEILRESGYAIKGGDIMTLNSNKYYFSLLNGSISQVKDNNTINISIAAAKILAPRLDLESIKDYGYDCVQYRECIIILDKYFTYQTERMLKSTKTLLI